MNPFQANLTRKLHQLLTQQSRMWCVVFAFGCMFSGLMNSPLHAAGCHYSSETIQGVDPFGNPLALNILKTYNGGEFQYYAIPEGRACDGPSCRSVPPIHITSQPAVTTSDRVDLSFLVLVESIVEPFYAGPLCGCSASFVASPVLDGLLRPPTV